MNLNNNEITSKQPEPAIVSKPRGMIVLDIGRLGWDFYEQLHNVIFEAVPDSHVAVTLTSQVYNSCLSWLVRWLGVQPGDAVEYLKTLPNSQELSNVIMHLRPGGLEILNNICQEYCLAVYLKIRQQLPFSNELQYLPVKVGYDHLVIREIFCSAVYVMSMPNSVIPFENNEQLQRKVFVDEEGEPVTINVKSDQNILIDSSGRVYYTTNKLQKG